MGDLDLTEEPGRIKQNGATSTIKDSPRIYVPGGLLPGGTSQDIYTQSATQNYAIGTRLVVDDRVFKYSLAGGNLIKMMGAYNESQWPINGALVRDYTVGANNIYIPDAVGAANAYAGGWIVVFTAPLQMRRIIANDASDGTEVRLWLDGAFEGAAVLIGVWVTGYPNIYSNVQSPPAVAPDYISFVCVPLITVTAGNYFWGQTWGPCYGVAGATVPGATAQNRWVGFSTAGNLISNGDANMGAGTQLAGFVLPRTSLGSGDQLYMLTLSP